MGRPRFGLLWKAARTCVVDFLMFREVPDGPGCGLRTSLWVAVSWGRGEGVSIRLGKVIGSEYNNK